MKFIIETPKRHANENGMYGQPIGTITIDEDTISNDIVSDLLETLIDNGFTMSPQ